MKLPLSESKMNSFLLTALPEAVLREDRRATAVGVREFYQHLQSPEWDSDVRRSFSALHAGAGRDVFALCHSPEYPGGDRILRGGFLSETDCRSRKLHLCVSG